MTSGVAESASIPSDQLVDESAVRIASRTAEGSKGRLKCANTPRRSASYVIRRIYEAQ